MSTLCVVSEIQLYSQTVVSNYNNKKQLKSTFYDTTNKTCILLVLSTVIHRVICIWYHCQSASSETLHTYSNTQTNIRWDRKNWTIFLKFVTHVYDDAKRSHMSISDGTIQP